MTPRKTMLAQLAEREEDVLVARAKVDETKQRARHAEAEAARLREALVEAFATDDQPQVAKLTRAVDKAEARAAEPWPERIAGAERAANRAQAEVDGWRIQNVRELLDEIAPDADAAAEGVMARVAELEEARRHWHQVSGRVSALIRDAGIGRTPNLDGPDAAIRALRRDLGRVPLPLPHMAAVATVAPEHDPDKGVRAAARAELLQEKARR
jgi:hypothetical protein